MDYYNSPPILQGYAKTGRKLNLLQKQVFDLAIYREAALFTTPTDKKFKRSVFRLMNKKKQNMNNTPSDFILKLSKIEVTRELVDLLFSKGTKIKQVKVSINESPFYGISVCIEIPHYEYCITESTIRYYSCSAPEHITNAFAIVKYIDNYIKTQ